MINYQISAIGAAAEIVSTTSLGSCGSSDELDVTEVLPLALLVVFDSGEDEPRLEQLLTTPPYCPQKGIEICRASLALDAWLGNLLHRHEIGRSIVLVISLPPDYSPHIDGRINEMLTIIQLADRHSLQMVVGVSDNPIAWKNCRGVDGFIAAEHPRRVQVALLVFSLFAANSGGDRSMCVDASDFRSALGGAFEPSVLIEGGWRSTESRLMFADEAREVFQKSQDFCIVLTQILTLSTLVQLTRASAQSLPLGARARICMCDSPLFNRFAAADAIVPVLALAR